MSEERASLAPLRLPVDRVTSEVDSDAVHTFELPGELAARVAAVAEDFGTSSVTVLVAAVKVLLVRYTDRWDLVPGLPTVDGSFSGAVRLQGAAVARTVVVPVVVPVDAPGDPAELAVTVTERGLSIQYPVRLFRETTIARLRAHFLVLLSQALADPGRPVTELSLVGEAERHRAVVDRNATGAEYQRDHTVPALFAELVAAGPREPAVLCDGETLSRAELDSRANDLAHRLVTAGVGPESPVGILLGRSPHAVIAMLAVLKAGGAYVPLHDSYPDDRVRWVLADTAAVVLLADRTTQARARRTGIPVIVLDDHPSDHPGDHLSKRPDAPAVAVHPGQLAYVMYTSGSTGVPKGVAVSHRNIVSLAADRRFATAAHRVVLFHSPHAFDAATYEVWQPLLTGGRIVLAPPELTPASLARLVTEHGITGMFLTSALFAHFAAESPRCFAGLQEVWTGGEAVSTTAVARVQEHCPGTTVVDVYGPTETTTFVTAHRLTPEEVAAGVAPIGRPMDNTRAYVLDEFLRPVADGLRGELYLAGDGVARGYFDRPALSAERFVADPFGTGGRLYRTGDLVRWNSDDELEFVGRTDAQVKIRGLRIEPGEIEAALRQWPGVSDAVVVVRATEKVRGLVAYLAAGDPGGLDQAALRGDLAERLPSYMVPARFVVLDCLPVNANGKVDRDALPEPGASDASIAPRTDTERLLAGIWTEVLGADAVGVTDSFVALGGDSVLAMKVVSLARAQGFTLSAKDLFEQPTIEELAVVADRPAAPAVLRRGGDAVPVELPAALLHWVAAGGVVEDVYSLTSMQSGMVFDALLARDWSLHLIQFTVTMTGVDDPGLLAQAWQHAALRHPVLRTAVFWEGVASPVQVVFGQVTLPVKQLDWRALPEQDRQRELRRLLDADQAAGVEPEHAPLARVTIVRTGDSGVTMLWSIHHVVVDGWSSAQLLDDVLADYAELRGGGTPRPRARRAFRDYVEWDQQGHPEAEAYWRARLAGLSAPTPLPVLDPPGSAQERPRATDSADVVVPDTLAQALDAYARRTGVTMNTLLQGAWAILLSRYCGDRDVCFGSTVSVRPAELPGVDSVVGLLINTIPVRVDVDDRRDPAAWLRELQQEQARGREFAAAPLPRIQAATEVPAGVNLFDSIVLFQNYPFAPGARAGDLDLVSVDVHFGLSFPLCLCVTPGSAGSGMAMRLLHDPERFDRRTITAMGEHLLALLGSVPGAAAVGDLSPLTGAERRTIVDEWSGTSHDRETSPLVHELIAERGLRWPHRTAVEHGERRLSYTELETRANALAHHLTSMGAGPEALVALAFEPGPELAAATLGVLKAGAACLPLDPRDPGRRLDAALTAARPVLASADPRFTHRLPGAEPLCLDENWPSGHTGGPPVVACGSRNLAQVVRAPGPDTRPRLVSLDHRSLVNAVLGLVESGRVRPGRVRHGNGALELFAALATGGTVVVPATGEGPAEHGIDRQYGAAEAGIAVAPHVADAESVHIGHALPNNRIYVLDARLAPVPAGVRGEVYVAGHGLARGYLGRPGLTARQFVPNPFGPPGSRLFRTGDLARWTGHGTLQLVGRVDRRVCLGGVDVDPCEVEDVLARHEDVASTTVAVREDGAGRTRLVAHVVPVPGRPAPAGPALRAHVAEFVPPQSVPSAFLLSARLPGGVVPEQRSRSARRHYAAPRNPTEEALCRIWSEVLAVDRVGAEDDFFALGGDSITSIRLLSRMREAFSVDLSPQDLFDQPRVAELADTIQDKVLERHLSAHSISD